MQRDLARSKTPCMRGSIVRENRETLTLPAAVALARSEDPERARMHLAREPGDPVIAHGRMVPRGRGGKSKDAIRR